VILDEIMALKRQELAARQRAVPMADLQFLIAKLPAPLDFARALARPGVSLIAEVKRASPSKGLLCPDFDPVHLATTYRTNGAAAISVLTDRHFFQGELEYLTDIRQALARESEIGDRSAVPNLRSSIPILRKDFIFHPYQVYETRAYGADALLLIVTILSDELLGDLLALTHELGMTALVEVHDEEEVKRALRWCPQVVGINNRHLQDFSVDLATFGRLRPLLPEGVVAVAESGVHTTADVRRLAEMSANAILVGEALVTAPDVAAKVRELVAGGVP